MEPNAEMLSGALMLKGGGERKKERERRPVILWDERYKTDFKKYFFTSLKVRS